MTLEQKKEYFKMVTELIRNERSEVDVLLSGLRIFIGNRSFWLDINNISFWNRVKLRALVREKADKQKRILEERHINHLKSLLNQSVVAQLKNTWEEGKKRQSTNNSGVSEPAIGKKPDAPPPSQKPEEIKFHGAEATINGAVHYIRMNPEQYSLWIAWLNHIAHQNFTESKALTGLLKLGNEHLLLNPRTASKTEAEKCMEKPSCFKRPIDNPLLAECIAETESEQDGESCLSLLLTPKQEQLWGRWLQLLNAHRKEPIKIPDAITELLHAGFTYSSLGYLDRSKPDANT